MKISIITATYNSKINISSCLQSAANQTYKFIEHIFIDGASTDKTLDIIKTYPTVTNYISEPDNGIYDALNKGINIANGDIIGFLHSDDQFYSTNIINDIVKLFQTSNADGVYGNLVFVNREDKITRAWHSSPFYYKNIKYGWAPPHPTLFLKKEVYQKHGLFDTSFKIAGDYDFMLRVMLDKEIKLTYLPKVITKMRIGGASTGNFKQLITKSKEDIRALRKNGFHFPQAVLVAKNLRKLPQLYNRSDY